MSLFLKLTLLTLYISALSNCEPSVIIIGAGPSGISAATWLLQNNITNVTILEAENRIGGRINTVKFGEKFVDVGAEYCHGKNYVYHLVAHLDILKPISNVWQPALYYSNGSKLDQAFTEELQAAILGYDSNYLNFNATGKNIGELFTKRYNATIVQKYSADPQKAKILNEALKLAEKVSLMIDGAFSWSDTSIVKHYERNEGHQLYVWGGRGYQTLLKFLTKEFPNPEQKLPIDDKVKLNKEVSKIVWNNDKVIVETSDDSHYKADHVIFTPSVGVLKERKDTLFSPSLPQSKLNAIEAIGMAGIMKIILHFEKEWWKSDDVLFAFLWSDEDLHKAAEEFPDGPVIDGVSWVSAITVMVKVPGNPNILIAWVTGEFVPDIEKTSESVLKDGCMYVLKKFFGENYKVAEPDQIIKSTWRSNPHFRGTYSYERAGFENIGVSYQVDLAWPLLNDAKKPQVFFAGEATSPVHYSTVHGAVESGNLAAQRIIDMYQQHIVLQ